MELTNRYPIHSLVDFSVSSFSRPRSAAYLLTETKASMPQHLLNIHVFYLKNTQIKDIAFIGILVAIKTKCV